MTTKEVVTVRENNARQELDLTRRPRRLRTNPAMRDIVAEARLHPEDLIQVLFVRDGIDGPVEISSMPGQYQHTVESLIEAVRQAERAGVKCIDLFGVPKDEDKDAEGSVAWDPEGILNRGIRAVRREFGNRVVIMADTCLDEFTDHGHCGPLTEDGAGDVIVDNDRSVELYERMAVAQAQAGAHVVSPSGMMDGQIAGIREALDDKGFHDVSIMAYSAKYASAFFGPFRDAVGSSLQGDRKTYQQDPANRRESILETQLDLEEGADMVMVKPAMAYLDVVREVADFSTVPVAVYQVSGEYAMIEAAAANGWVDRERIVLEALTGMRRAGADLIFTYYATEVAQWLAQGKR
nr:porphobilinogen synthase [Kocuria sp. 257]